MPELTTMPAAETMTGGELLPALQAGGAVGLLAAQIAQAPRGAMMLAALRCRVGKAEMGDLVRAWVAAHRDSTGTGTGTGAQFRALASAETGEDLDAFFQHWLDDTTKPAETADNGLGGCA